MKIKGVADTFSKPQKIGVKWNLAFLYIWPWPFTANIKDQGHRKKKLNVQSHFIILTEPKNVRSFYI